MPFDSLSPESQKFLKKYFKATILLRKGTTDKEKDSMADDLIAFQTARDRAKAMLDKFPPGSGGTGLRKELADAENTVTKDKKALQATSAKATVDLLITKIGVAADTYTKGKQQQASNDIKTMKTYMGVVLKVPKYEERLKVMGTDFGKDPPDLIAVKAGADAIKQGKADLKIYSDGYKTNFDIVTGMIKTNGTDRMGEVADPVVAKEKADIQKKLALSKQKLDEGNAFLAANLASEVKWEMNAAAKIVTEKNAYLVVKQTATTEIAKLTKARNPGVDEECNRIDEAVRAANEAEVKRDYYTATNLMEPMKDRVAELLPIADANHKFNVAAKKASEAFIELKKHPQILFVQPDVLVIQAHVDAAVDMAGAANYAQATNRLGMVPGMCTDAANKAATAAPFDAITKDMATGDLSALLIQAKALVADLQKHPKAGEITQALADLGRDVGVLEREVIAKNEPAAREALKKVVELATGARKLADIIDKISVQADSLDQRRTGLGESHSQAKYVATQLKTVSDHVESARAAAKTGNEGAFASLALGEADLNKARKLADGEENYRFRRAELEKKIKEAAGWDYPDKVETATAITDHLIKANDHSKAFEHIKCEGSMKAIEALLAIAKVGKDAKAGTSPSADEIKAIIALPNGERLLDKMIENLPGTAQQKVLADILKARFNMDVKIFDDSGERAKGVGEAKTDPEMTNPDPNLLKYYKMMVAVPDSHTKLNPSLARFDQVEDGTGSYYESSSGAVVMACFTAMDTPANMLNNPAQLEAVEVDCQPRTDTPQPSYGKWTALHEIGHAVDDRKGFMNANGNKDAFGGWTSYGSNVSPIAKVLADEFDYDLSYIEQKMAGGAPDIPEIPESVQTALGVGAATEWTKRRNDFQAWLDAVRSTTGIWSNVSEAKNRAIDGIAYHEAYPNSWVSYKLAARSQGIKGYQFRAPGEWFSELYAAYFSGKLKPAHPANKWLSTL